MVKRPSGIGICECQLKFMRFLSEEDYRRGMEGRELLERIAKTMPPKVKKQIILTTNPEPNSWLAEMFSLNKGVSDGTED